MVDVYHIGKRYPRYTLGIARVEIFLEDDEQDSSQEIEDFDYRIVVLLKVDGETIQKYYFGLEDFMEDWALAKYPENY